MIHILISSNTQDTGIFGMSRYSSNPNFRTKLLDAVSNPDNYFHAASFIDSDNLEDIWEAMQSDCSGIPRQIFSRSMMVGDVILTSDKVFVVDSCGFTQIKADPSVFAGKINNAPVFSAVTKQAA